MSYCALILLAHSPARTEHTQRGPNLRKGKALGAIDGTCASSSHSAWPGHSGACSSMGDPAFHTCGCRVATLVRLVVTWVDGRARDWITRAARLSDYTADLAKRSVVLRFDFVSFLLSIRRCNRLGVTAHSQQRHNQTADCERPNFPSYMSTLSYRISDVQHLARRFSCM